MEPLVLEKCATKKCDHKATVINGESYYYCLSCLTSGSDDKIIDLRNKLHGLSEKNQTGSIFDGRSDAANHFFPLPLNEKTKQDADYRGSIFISVDLSSEDFEKTDFSFCNFIGCDLRRIRLYNSSLRWARFHKSLLKQADINSSDCRWLQAQSVKEIKEINGLAQALEMLIEKANKKNKFPLHDIRPNDIRCLFNRFGFIITDEEVKIYAEQSGIGKLKNVVDQYSSEENKLDNFIADFQTEIGEKTIWSGASIINSDLSYAWFDHTEAIEVSFDGSDLFRTSFNHAELNRSSFKNSSFSRLTPTDSQGDDDKKKRFEKTKMNGCILEGTNLEKIHFTGTYLNNANLKNAHISKAMFYNCEIKDAILDDVVGEGSKFINSNLSGCSLIGIILNKAHFFSAGDGKNNFCDLTGVNLQAAGLAHVDFTKVCLNGALLQGANLANANLKKAVCLGAQFAGCDITSCDFSQAILTSCDFSSSGFFEKPPIFNSTIMRDIDLSGMNLEKTVFSNCDLDGANLAECRLSQAEFSSSDPFKKMALRRAVLKNSEINNAKFVNVDLMSSDLSFAQGDDRDGKIFFNDCKLYMSSFKGSFFCNLEFNKCNLSKVDFSDSDIKDSKFVNCHMNDISFRGSELYGIEIKNIESMSGADFTGANFYSYKEKVNAICDAKQSLYSIKFDRCSLVSIKIRNVRLVACSFNGSYIDIGIAEDFTIASSSIDNSKFRLTLKKQVKILYTPIKLTQINLELSESIDHHDDNVYSKFIILGCMIDECMFGKESSFDAIFFADCTFCQTSIFADAKLLRKISSSLFLHCKFSNLKYHGFAECARELGSIGNDFDCSIDDFLKDLQDNIIHNISYLRRIMYCDDKDIERLNILIPGDSNPQRMSLRVMRLFCIELRKDLFQIGLHNSASRLYIKERNFQILINAQNGCLSSFKQQISTKNSFFIYSAFLLFIIMLSFLSRNYSSLFIVLPVTLLVFFILPFRLFRMIPHNEEGTWVSDFLAKNLYNYGESFSLILIAALVSILSFSFCYYSFLPDSLHDFHARSVDLKSILSSPGVSYKSGYICDGNSSIVTEPDSFIFPSFSKNFPQFLKCIYFSGVTFTTLGYGDIQPHGLVRFFAMIESGVGAFFMALFVFSFTRRNALR